MQSLDIHIKITHEDPNIHNGHAKSSCGEKRWAPPKSALPAPAFLGLRLFAIDNVIDVDFHDLDRDTTNRIGRCNPSNTSPSTVTEATVAKGTRYQLRRMWLCLGACVAPFTKSVRMCAIKIKLDK
jgi:hypothetical protein